MLTYLEAMEDDSRANFQFDQTGGSARVVYHTEVGRAPDIQEIARDILGYTNPFANSNGLSTTGQKYLTRTLPVTHPKCPYLYAQRIASLVGKGSGTAAREAPTPPANPLVGANPIAPFLRYRQYEIVVDFASRPYPLIDNNSFSRTQTGKWYTKNGTPNEFTYSPEWCRFCDYDLIPQDNTIQGQQGSMTMWGVPGKAAGIPYQSPPWVWLPDQILKVRWYQVPLRFVTSTNSYIAGSSARNWRGRVNQNPWWNWKAGELLYMGYAVTKYSPPFNDVGTYPSYLPLSTDPGNVGTLLNYERLCDIELTFLMTRRYRSGSLGADIQNGNHVAGGHNLLPNLSDNNFYYGTRTPLSASGATGTASVQNPPAWYSFPVEALFSDPDADGGPTTAGDN